MSGKGYAILGLIAGLLNLGAMWGAFQVQKQALNPLLAQLHPPAAPKGALAEPAQEKSDPVPAPKLILAEWDAQSEELAKLSKELQQAKEEVSTQKESLQVMITLLENEKKELQSLKAEIVQQKQTINDSLTQVESGEEKNLRTLATTYMGLNPEAAAAVITQMDEGLAAKILFFMTPEAVALIFQQMSASGKPPALQRIARLSEKLRLAQSAKKP